MIRLSKSVVGKAESEAVAHIIEDIGYLGMGATVGEFEHQLEQYIGGASGLRHFLYNLDAHAPSVEAFDVDVDFRVALGYEETPIIIAYADMQVFLVAFTANNPAHRCLLEGISRCPVPVNDLFGELLESFAFFGEGHRISVPGKQPDAYTLFNLRYVLADRRLAYAQPFRGLGEAALFTYCHEDVDP